MDIDREPSSIHRRQSGSLSPGPGPTGIPIPPTPTELRNQSSSPSASSTSSEGTTGSTSSGTSTRAPCPLQLLSPSKLGPSTHHNHNHIQLSGVLTPPTDNEDNNNGHGVGRRPKGTPKGRLTFYKEGVLCLELNHWDDDGADGESGSGTGDSHTHTKWHKSDKKINPRNIIRVTKEVRIPHPTTASVPSLVPSPGGTRTTSPVVPAPRKSFSSFRGIGTVKSGRKPLQPHHGFGDRSSSPRSTSTATPTTTTEQYLFYMRPGPCLLQQLLHFRRKSPSLQRTYSRRPYSPITIPQSSPKLPQANACNCSSTTIKIEKSNKLSTNTTQSRSLDQIISTILKTQSKSPPISTSAPVTPVSQSQPRKRASPNNPTTAAPDPTSASPIRPKVKKSRECKPKSPKKNRPKNTILSVPGIHVRGSLGQNSSHPSPKRFSSSPNTTGTSAVPLPLPMFYQEPPGGPESEDEDQNKDQGPGNQCGSESGSLLGSLTPEEQQQFQQEAMSKAISYTINSLLGGGAGGSSINPPNGGNLQPSHRMSGASLPLPLHGTDQTSFLRHLLDTSDPIPKIPGGPGTGTRKTPPASSATPTNQNHCNSHNNPQPQSSHSSPATSPYTNAYSSPSPFRPVFTSPSSKVPPIQRPIPMSHHIHPQLDEGDGGMVLDLSAKGPRSRAVVPSHSQSQTPRVAYANPEDQDFPLNLCKKSRPN